jgi:hypothetical protein
MVDGSAVVIDYRLPMATVQESPDCTYTIKGICYVCTTTSCRPR